MRVAPSSWPDRVAQLGQGRLVMLHAGEVVPATRTLCSGDAGNGSPSSTLVSEGGRCTSTPVMRRRSPGRGGSFGPLSPVDSLAVPARSASGLWPRQFYSKYSSGGSGEGRLQGVNICNFNLLDDMDGTNSCPLECIIRRVFSSTQDHECLLSAQWTWLLENTEKDRVRRLIRLRPSVEP